MRHHARPGASTEGRGSFFERGQQYSVIRSPSEFVCEDVAVAEVALPRPARRRVGLAWRCVLTMSGLYSRRGARRRTSSPPCRDLASLRRGPHRVFGVPRQGEHALDHRRRSAPRSDLSGRPTSLELRGRGQTESEQENGEKRRGVMRNPRMNAANVAERVRGWRRPPAGFIPFDPAQGVAERSGVASAKPNPPHRKSRSLPPLTGGGKTLKNLGGVMASR